MNTAISLVVYISAAFFPGEPEPRYLVTENKVECVLAVAEVRSTGVFATDCAQATLGKPSNGGNGKKK